MSFTGAALELGYTQSAVSNHVRSLEEFVGRPLFVRHPRSLTLTGLGVAYLPAVRRALGEIDKATESIITTLHEKKVVISCPLSLAQNWLTQVVANFFDHHPDIAISILGTLWADDLDTVADIKLVSSRPDEIPQNSQMLWQESLAIVCSPEYKVNGQPIQKPSDLRDARPIHILGRTEYWQDFAAHFDLKGWNLASGAQTNSLTVALELAAKGMGCAILPRSQIGSYLNGGLLVEPFKLDLVSPWSCYISKAQSGMSRHAQLVHDFIANSAPP